MSGTPTLSSLHLIETQMIDNDNNHIFCVFEDDDNNVYINILKQATNRVVAYEQKIEESIIPIFTTNISESIISIIDNNNYDIGEENFDTCIFLTPISATHVDVIYPKISTIENTNPLYVNKVFGSILNK